MLDLDKPPGAAWLVPSGTEFWTDWREDAEYGQLVIAPATFADLSADLLDGRERPASALLGVDEPQLARIFQLVRDELEAGLPTGTLYLEGLGLAAVARLVTNKAATRARSPVRGGLSPGALRRVQALVRDGHAPSELSLSALAVAAGLSRFHFLRAFRASTGLTPAQYVARERVSRAEGLLRSTRLPISEICRIMGFGSLDQLYRAFSTIKGQTPGSLRRKGSARDPLPPVAD